MRRMKSGADNPENSLGVRRTKPQYVSLGVQAPRTRSGASIVATGMTKKTKKGSLTLFHPE
jgi:hypothetical protein